MWFRVGELLFLGMICLNFFEIYLFVWNMFRDRGVGGFDFFLGYR